MTAASHSVPFAGASCQACRSQFSIPHLGDFNYGDFIFYGERQSVFGFLRAPNEPACEDIEAHLRRARWLPASPTPSDFNRLHRVIAASADFIGGQRLVPYPVCPSCGSSSIASGDFGPQGGRDIPKVSFSEYRSLADNVKTQRVTELWREFA